MNIPVNVNRPAPLRNVAAFATMLQRMVDRGPELPGLAVWFGPSGYGKSRSAVYGANRHRAAYLELGQFTTARTLMGNILKELGGGAPRGSIEEMKDRAIEIMAADPRRPLLVDEVHHIAEKRMVDLLRELSDKSGAPVILIGEEKLPLLLEASERVHNRVLEWLPAQPSDVAELHLLAKVYCPTVSIEADLAEAMVARTEGNTRRIVVNLAQAANLAKLQGLKSMSLEGFGGPAAIIGRVSIKPRNYR